MTIEEAVEERFKGPTVHCPHCEGWGWRTPEDPKKECGPCKGWGVVVRVNYVESCMVLGYEDVPSLFVWMDV